MQAIINATLKKLLVQINSDLGCEVTCDVRMIMAKNINVRIVAFLSLPHFVCQKLCVMNGQHGTN